VSWYDVLGVSILAGAGFTVSLLVSDLSFTGAQSEAAKAAVLVASTFAATSAGLLLLARNRWHRTAATSR